MKKSRAQCYTRHINNITVKDDRIRKNIPEKDIQELADDIEKNGLLHPIAIGCVGTNTSVLVAGERRLRALKEIFSRGTYFEWSGNVYEAAEGIIPVVYLDTEHEADALEIEIQENIMRKDLDWKDVVSARARLHELRVEQAKEREEKWTIADTAKELKNMHPTTAAQSISRATVLADHLDDPGIKYAKSEADAWRQLSKKIEGEFILALEEKEKEKEETVESKHRLFLSPIEDLQFEQKEFDIIIADPPYGIGADERFGPAGNFAHGYDDSEQGALKVIETIIINGHAWTKDIAHLYIFCDVHLFTAIYRRAKEFGWKPFRTPLIWHHPPRGNIPWGPHSYKRMYDMIFYATKGNAQLNKLSDDILTFAKEESSHAARKPVSLYESILRLSVDPGSHVLDPTCGSGPVFPAAHNYGCIATGCDNSKESYLLAAKEIGALKENNPLAGIL